MGWVTYGLHGGARAPSSDITEILSTGEVSISSKESSCSEPPAWRDSAPGQPLVQVAQLGENRQAEYRLKTNQPTIY